MNAPRFHHADLAGDVVTFDERESRHALVSLRLRPGDRVELFDGRGTVACGRVTSPEQDAGPRGRKRGWGLPRLRVYVEQREQIPPPSGELHLIVPACKGDRLRWMVEKCTELGVTRLLLANFERSVVCSLEGRIEKTERYALEACKQCGRNWLPEIIAVSPSESIVAARSADALLVAHPDRDGPTLSDWLAQQPAIPASIAAVIGPEGGLTDGERGTLLAAGGHAVRLAEHILRVETAAVAVAAVWASHSR